MNLKEFQEHQFTENTQIKYQGEWCNVMGVNFYDKAILYSDNSVMVFCKDIQQLREKPSELFVNVFKDGTVLISEVEDTNNYESLKYRFKAVESITDGEVWTMLYDKNGNHYKIFNKEQHCFVYQNVKTIGKYIKYKLQLLYEAPEEAEPELKEIELLDDIDESVLHSVQYWNIIRHNRLKINEQSKTLNQLIRRAK